MPESELNEWERRYANYVLTGNEGFFPGGDHPAMGYSMDRALLVLEDMGLGPGAPEATSFWSVLSRYIVENRAVFGIAMASIRTGDECYPAESPPAGERLEYTETPRDAAARATTRANAQQQTSSQVHGNSLNSPRPTWLYRLVNVTTGQVMKYGITSRTNPVWRYTQWYYQQNNVRLEPIAQGQRWHMYQLEYQLNVKNNSPWSRYGH